MAKVSFSALIEEITGKLAGSVFQDSYGGLQVRTRVSPRNPRSNFQQLRRGEFGFLSASWRNLTSTERQTFIDNASSPGAALNLFLQANVNLTLINEPTITTYVPSSDPGTMDILFKSAEAPADPVLCPPKCGAMKIQATGGTTVVPAGTKLLVQVTFPKLPTRIFTNPSQYSPIISFDEGTDLAITQDIITEWHARYGILTANKRLCLKANLIDKSNGLRGADMISCTNSEEMAKYIPLQFFDTDVAYTGGADENLYTYPMPGNTVKDDGDRLEICYWLSSVAFTPFGGLRITIDGQSTANYLVATGSEVCIKATVTKASISTARVTTSLESDGHTIHINGADLSSLDFTNDMNIDLNIEFAGIMTATARHGYIDLIKAP